MVIPAVKLWTFEDNVFNFFFYPSDKEESRLWCYIRKRQRGVLGTTHESHRKEYINNATNLSK